MCYKEREYKEMYIFKISKVHLSCEFEPIFTLTTTMYVLINFETGECVDIAVTRRGIRQRPCRACDASEYRNEYRPTTLHFCI